MWNARYGEAEYVYGTEPNHYFATQLAKLPAGRLLLPAEGEGRNATFAASQGWQVEAFDQSSAGQVKALRLAEARDVHIDYQVAAFDEVAFAPATFDAIGLIYAHFPADRKAAYHQRLATWLRPGGYVILEAFSKEQLRYQAFSNSGGPRDRDMLFSVKEILQAFAGFDVLEAVEEEITLQEGRYHDGLASVVRFVGRRG